MKGYLVVLLSLITTLAYPQQTKFSFAMGDEYLVPWSAMNREFVGDESFGIAEIYTNLKKLTIVKFDPKSLNKTSENTIDLPGMSKTYRAERVVNPGDNYYWLHSEWDNDSESELLYADKIDIASGKITESNKKLIQASKMAGYYIERPSGPFYVKYNFDYDMEHKKLLITYRLWPEERNDKINYDRIGFFVFDENLNKLWGNEFTMPYTEAISDNSDFSVDGNGNAYLLSKIYDSERRRERDKETGAPAYHYEIFKFVKNNKKIITVNIPSDDYFFQEASLMETVNHNVLAAFSYSKKSSGRSTDGIFLATIDDNNKIVKFKTGYYEFPLSELTKFESEKAKRKMEEKGDYEIANLKVRDIVVQDDGSIFVACEEFYIKHSASNQGSTSNTYKYFYENIIAAKINNSGQFEWMRKIPKRQKSLEEGGSRFNPYAGSMGFKSIYNSSGYYFLYIDNKKNLELKEEDVPKLHLDDFGGQVMLAKLSPSGVLTKEILFDPKDENLKIYPTEFKRLSNSQLIGRGKVKNSLNYRPLAIFFK